MLDLLLMDYTKKDYRGLSCSQIFQESSEWMLLKIDSII